MRLYCWRNGIIGLGRYTPAGAMEILAVSDRRLRRIVSAAARHAKEDETLLVPGIPEAESDVEAMKAVRAFRNAVLKRLYKQPATMAAAS